MNKHKIGFLHPGAMGVSLAANTQANGHATHWVSMGRGASTAQRAQHNGMVDAGTVESLCETCATVISICPPHAADDVADEVIAAGFTGTYLDANAISPQRACDIGSRLADAGIEFVDGGVIGGPAWQDGTILYLAGEQAESIAKCFELGHLETRIVSDRVGDASALKMCYAAYSKGSMALLSSIVAASEKLGVRQALETQWEIDEPGFTVQTHAHMSRLTRKAWRYVGEMNEIAATFEAANLPDGFHKGAADIYQRIAGLRNEQADPSLEQVLDHLIDPKRE